MVPPARLVIVALPPLLADVVRAILAGEAGVEVVAEVGPDAHEVEQLADAVAAHRPDVVITGAPDGGLSRPMRSLLYRFPLLPVLSLSTDGRSAAVWRLVPERRTIAEVSATGLTDALRGVRDGAA